MIGVLEVLMQMLGWFRKIKISRLSVQGEIVFFGMKDSRMAWRMIIILKIKQYEDMKEELVKVLGE